MDNKDKAWLLALAFSIRSQRETTHQEFFSEIENAENEFLSLLNERDAKKKRRFT
ncbi:hypothetical protein O5479_13750 [Escherichia coli]|uniref:Uncharacterized protein n=1 Tax=Escherichia coli TaxID=562 RepID=A0A376KTG1_ECOLX|nr:hypothetical protein [Escherichia coli]MCZ5496659.1 hypothetical protein [Escherichia coli]MCZ5975785.1 hypothetical protein [Escherichia coli]STE85652.1 Uncharacterised protein [Escherichia coli]